MLNADEILSLPRDEDEALLLLSALGFGILDWPFIKSLGPLQLLTPKIIDLRLKKFPKNLPYLMKFFLSMHKNLDHFYKEGGFLFTPKSNSSLFLSKESPLVFFGRGNKEILFIKPSVAIVGSRKASKDACLWTSDLAKQLSHENILIISGGALGIDEAAHSGAKITCSILGMPVNFLHDERPPYIKSFNGKNLVSLTPFGSWQPSQKYMFVKRNQFVVGLADVLVVVQGMQGSGTLHTAKFALDLKKPIFAVPGALNDPLAYVPNQLLSKGWAKVTLSSEEILVGLNMNLKKAQKKQERPVLTLPPLLELIKDKGKALTIDELIHYSGSSLNDIQNQLLEYEMDGLIKRQGAQFVLLV